LTLWNAVRTTKTVRTISKAAAIPSAFEDIEEAVAAVDPAPVIVGGTVVCKLCAMEARTGAPAA